MKKKTRFCKWQELKLIRRAKRRMTARNFLAWRRHGGGAASSSSRVAQPPVASSIMQTLIRFYAVDVQQTPPQCSRYWSVYREGVFMTDINRLVHSSVCCNTVVIAGNIYKDKSERFHVYNLTFLFTFLSSNLGVGAPCGKQGFAHSVSLQRWITFWSMIKTMAAAQMRMK